MTTPIIDFVNNYIKSNNIRLHMPGHKGKELLGFEMYDITEFDGADVLYHAHGIIKESMNNASALFGTQKTLYSAEGSSLSIRAMLYLAMLYAKSIGRKAKILACRNAHKVFVMSAALLDFEIDWLYGKNYESITSCSITAEEIDKTLSEYDEKPCAVYVTSPDYLGNILDIKAIAAVCEKHDVLLLTDNAHGAYLNFLEENMHPINLGAHICCDSAHKTLPALTGAGYLHISKKAPKILAENAEKAMTLFASTSPSYLILQSLDAVNKYLSGTYRKDLSEYCKNVSDLKRKLCDMGYANESREPLKLTFTPKKFGYRGNELKDYLAANDIICEFYDPDYLVLMLTPQNGEDTLMHIHKVMSALEIKEEIKESPPKIPCPQRATTIKEAVFSDTRKLPLKESLGKIYAGICVSCPPAIPIAVCGEVVDEDVMRCLEYYGEEEIEIRI